MNARLPVMAAALVFAMSAAYANNNDSTSGMSSTSEQTSMGSQSGSSTVETNRDAQGADRESMANMPMKQGHNYEVIQFKKGSAELTAASKNSLKKLVDNAKASGHEISESYLAVWSDKKFPMGKNAKDLPKKDQELVEKRIEAINNYMSETLQLSKAETFNMAEKSNWFARAFNTDEAELKSLFSQQGAPAKVDSNEFKIVKSKGGPMKAVILFEMPEMAQKSGAMNRELNGLTYMGYNDDSSTMSETTTTTTDESAYDDEAVSESMAAEDMTTEEGTVSGATSSDATLMERDRVRNDAENAHYTHSDSSVSGSTRSLMSEGGNFQDPTDFNQLDQYDDQPDRDLSELFWGN